MTNWMDTPIRRLDDDLFAVEGLFRAAGGVRFPVRSTIVRRAEGLTIVAPIAASAGTEARKAADGAADCPGSASGAATASGGGAGSGAGGAFSAG